MANYSGWARSNYFSVNDPEAFKAWCNKRGVHYEHTGDEQDLWAIFGPDDDYGVWPCNDPETEEPIDVAHELSEHLAKGEVAILMEIGNEKLRYLTGYAVAINSEGDERRCSLSDIYDLAEQIGDVSNITTCEY